MADNESTRRVFGQALRNPSRLWSSEDLDDREILYQIWRCLHSIRAIMIAWLLTAVIAAVVWFVIFNAAKDKVQF